jgi:hypothetical protein
MNNDERSQYITRDSILKLLSDDEIASVATAETAERLADGFEYLDMEQLNLGVLRASADNTPMGRVLPRTAVHQMTWDKILHQLAELRGATRQDAA